MSENSDYLQRLYNTNSKNSQIPRTTRTRSVTENFKINNSDNNDYSTYFSSYNSYENRQVSSTDNDNQVPRNDISYKYTRNNYINSINSNSPGINLEINKMDYKLSDENGRLKQENSKLISEKAKREYKISKLKEESKKIQQLYCYLKQNYSNYDISQPPELFIDQIIKEKDKALNLIKQEQKKYIQSVNLYKEHYEKHIATLQKIKEIASNEINYRGDTKKTSAIKFVNALIRKKNCELDELNTKISSGLQEDSKYKKELETIKDYLVQNEELGEFDQQKTEFEMIQTILKDKNDKLNKYSSQKSILEKKFAPIISENQNIKNLLIHKRIVQKDIQNIDITQIIDQIISEKTQFEEEIASITEKNKLLEEENIKLRKTPILIDQLESVLNNLQKQNVETNKKLDDINSDTKCIRNKISFQNNTNYAKTAEIEKDALDRLFDLLDNNDDSSIIDVDSEERYNYLIKKVKELKDQNEDYKNTNSNEKKVLIELMAILKVPNNDSSFIEKDSKVDYGLLIESIKNMKEQNETFALQNNYRAKPNQLSYSKVDTIEINNTPHANEAIDEIIEILNISNDSSFNTKNSEEKYNYVIEKIREITNNNHNNIDNENNINNQTNSQEKKVLLELIEILNIPDNGNSEINYDELKNKIIELTKIKENPYLGSNRQEIHDCEEKIQLLRKQVDDQEERIIKLHNENKYLQQQKNSSEELLRRHVKLIKTENDKQIRRMKYLQQMEIKELINQPQS